MRVDAETGEAGMRKGRAAGAKRLHRFRRFTEDSRGATAVEFALVMIPFLGLICATIDMGVAFFIERNLDATTQNAARQIRTGAVQGAGIVTAQKFVTGYVCPPTGSLLGSFIDCTKLIIDVRTGSSLTNNDLSNDFYKTPTTNQFCLGSPKTVTVVRIAYPMPWFIPVIGTNGAAQRAGLVNDVPNNPGWKLLITSASAVRTEPYPSAQYATYQAKQGC